MLLAALGGCGSDGPSVPAGPIADIPVRLCTTADWFAYRNEGDRWTRLVPRDGEMTFDATARLAFALANAGAAPQLHVEYLTASQLVAIYGCDRVVQAVPAERIGGVVRGLAAGGQAQVAYGRFGSFVTALDTTYDLPVDGGSSDLVAARLPGFSSLVRADRVILRRAQRYPAGTDLPIDFAAAEAFAPEERELRFDGVFAYVLVQFWTATTRPFLGGVDLQSASVGEAGAGSESHRLPLFGIPVSRLLDGDMHRVMLDDMAGRKAEAYYRAPRDLSIAFGPPAPLPTFVTEATTPNRRLRAEIPVQAEYDAGAWMFVHPTGAAGGSVMLSATREYFGGTPTVAWSLAVPDLTGVDGFETRFGLPSSGQLRWSMAVTGRPGGELAPLVPTDGLTFRSAARDGLVP
jgi:hypothetical protein